MLPAKIIPRDEERLHGRVVAQALAVAVREPRKPPHAHPVSEVEPLDMAGAYFVLVTVAEHRQLFYVGYLGWAVAGHFLGAAVVLYQDREVYLRLEGERNILPIGCEAIGR